MVEMIRYLSQTDPKKLRGTVLLRLDFNTEDDWRLRAALPTVKFLLRYASKIVVVSHKGRPKGFDKKLSLRKDAARLSSFLHRKVGFITDLRPKAIKKIVAKSPKGSIFVLENIRFLRGESENRPEFARALAAMGDYYVNDAFAVCHRAAASVVGITRFLPSYAGLELEKEIEFLSSVLGAARKPLVFILGGSKAADKLGAIEHFKNRADYFLLGGAPANTVLFLKGADIKKSLRDKDKGDLKNLLELLRYKNIFLPTDFVWYRQAIVDAGPETVKKFTGALGLAKTIIWSGPLGFIEKKPYDRGTLAIARAIAKNRKAFSLTGGGETVMFLKKYGLDKKFSFVSTGGGAMLEFLAGKKLPGIEALK